jgi:hypothetical protein
MRIRPTDYIALEKHVTEPITLCTVFTSCVYLHRIENTLFQTNHNATLSKISTYPKGFILKCYVPKHTHTHTHTN